MAALSRRHYESSHLPGAINLPYEFVDDAEEVLPDKGADIVVYEGERGVRIVAREVEATVKALTSSIEPLMIVVVGGIVIAMYVPMFKIFALVK